MNLTLQKNVLSKSLLVDLSCTIFPSKFWKKNKIQTKFSFIRTHLKKKTFPLIFLMYIFFIDDNHAQIIFCNLPCQVHYRVRSAPVRIHKKCTNIEFNWQNINANLHNQNFTKVFLCEGSNRGNYSLHILNKFTNALCI